MRKAIKLARRARAAGDWPTVVLHCSEALRADPRLSLLWNNLAHAQKRHGDLAGAEASYRRSLGVDDRWAKTHLELGHVLKLQGRFTEAANSYLRSVITDPTVSQARVELSALGFDRDAIAAAMETGSIPFPPPLASIEEARHALATKDWNTVAKCYADLLHAQPRWSAIWAHLGHTQEEHGDLPAAEYSYRRAVAIESQAAGAHLQLGHVLKLQHRFTEAAESYLAALRLHPADIVAKGELSAFGYDEITIEAVRQGGVLPSPPAVPSIVVADRARAKRHWSSAAQHYVEALRAQPQWAAIWVQFGHAQKEQGDLIGAEARYRQSMTIEPCCADAYLQLGHVLKLQGRFTEAAASYFNAVQLEPRAADGFRARRELLALGYLNSSISAALQNGTLSWLPPAEDINGQGSRRLLSIVSPNLSAVPDDGGGPPVLFRQQIQLKKGDINIFVDIQTVSSPTVPKITIAVTGANGELPVHPVSNKHGPHIATFRCRTDVDVEAEFVLKADLPPDCLIRRIEVGSADDSGAWVLPHRWPTMADLPYDRIRNLIIGTTGMCNASCIHCPTNKLRASARWTSDMPMNLFHRLVDQILENEMFITGYISLGLFGDGLVDRNVVERASRLRSTFPYAPLHVNTNGAAYNSSQHCSLGSLVDTVAIHIESLDEEKYARLMEPLKLHNVLPKIHQIIKDMPNVTAITSPVHRDNIAELPNIREYFSGRGVTKMIFAPISNRCSRDDAFRQLAINPTSGSCAEDIIFDLIVDWDGLVLVCCNDFLRREPIGNLARESLLEILRGPRRRRVLDTLRTGAWEEMETCRTCKF